MFSSKAETFAIGNTEMHYVVFGKGEVPLLIIPGLGDGVQNVGKSSKALAFFYSKWFLPLISNNPLTIGCIS